MLRLHSVVCTALVVWYLVTSSAVSADTSLGLNHDGPERVHVGETLRIEIRASFERSLTALMFDLTISGSSTALLTARSADPIGQNGLTYISSIEQIAPFESGLPHDLSSGPAREVLLHFGQPPFDGVPPNSDAVVAWVDITPTQRGSLTIQLSNPQIISTQWHRNGISMSPITIEPDGAAVTVDVTSHHDADGDGDTDLVDVMHFQSCFAGSNISPANALCLTFFDEDEDGDIDLLDFAALLSVLYGPGAAETIDVTSHHDADGDGDTDLVDVMQFQSCFAGSNISPAYALCLTIFDEDEDGDIDLLDFAALLSVFHGPGVFMTESTMVANEAGTTAGALGTDSADVTGDEAVTDEDLVFVRQHLLEDPLAPEHAAADANADGVIDLLDLVFVRNRIGETTYGQQSLTPDLRITELNILPDTGPLWVELTNAGPGMLDTGPYYLSNQQGGFNYNLGVLPDSLKLIPPGFRLVISFDGPAEPTWIGDETDPDGAIVHVGAPFLPLDPQEDACRLHLLDFASLGPLLDRVAWGGPEQVDSVLNPQVTQLPPGASIGREEYENDLWRIYATPTPGYPNGMAPLEPYFPYANHEFGEGDPIRFVWIDVRYGELQYRLQVAGVAGFGTPLVDELITDTLYDLPASLAAGSYTWRVRIEAGDFVSDWSEVAAFSVDALSGQLTSDGSGSAVLSSTVALEWFRQNPLPLPRKDTQLLCLECMNHKGAHAWDITHDKPHKSCPHGKYYGAFTVIAAINHYYGGSVLLDQLSVQLNVDNEFPTRIQAFGHDSGWSGIGQADAANLVWALGFDTFQVTPQEVSLQAGNENSIENVLRDGRPILAYRKTWNGECNGAPLLVFGYHLATANQPERFEALDPQVGESDGLSFSVTAPVSTLQCAYTIPTAPAPGGAVPIVANPEMSRDTDGDGVMDFDENDRFFTLVENRDSDGDGIDDKTEIFSYQFGKGRVKRKPDIDGDSLRAEMDADGDNDGCPDGEEDKNHNGKFEQRLSADILDLLSDFPGAQSTQREKAESDPFFKDVYDLVLTAGRANVAFGKSVPIEITLKYNESSEKKQGVAEATIKLEIVDDQDRGTLADSEVTTDKNGRATTTFTAGGTISGDVLIKAVYQQCENAVAQWEAFVTLSIADVDWMFAIQTKARLTQLETLQLGATEVSPLTPQAPGRVQRRNSRFKNGGFQQVEGFFYHPDVAAPGRFIDQISIVPEYSDLYVNGALVAGRTWSRSNENEEPQTWKIVIADPDAYPNDRLPRSLLVQGEGFQVYTPLVTWASIESDGIQNRDFVQRGDTYKILSYAQTSQTATFYFGDGASGYDTGSNLWPANPHTNVSFIPMGTVAGYEVGHLQSDGWWSVFDWPTQSGDVAFIYNVFGTDKNDVQIIPPFSWSVLNASADTPDDLAEGLRQEIEGLPLVNPPPLLSDFVFQRDYLPAEQDALEQRGLVPPEYLIDMLVGD